MRHYPFTHVNPAILQQTVDLYQSGLTTQQVAKQLGKSRASVSIYLKSQGIKTRFAGKRYLSLDEHYFDAIDTVEKAYWLGFLLADGHIAKRKIRVNLQWRDAVHLEKLRLALKSEATVKKEMKGDGKSKKRHPSALVEFCSAYMRRSLLHLGWAEFKKTGSLRVLNSVPSQWVHIFMRGLFDGDGSVYVQEDHRKGRKQKSLICTFTDEHRNVVQWFQRVLMRESGLNRTKIQPSKQKSAFTIRYGGNLQCQRIAQFLYSGEGPFLSRKRNRFSSCSL